MFIQASQSLLELCSNEYILILLLSRRDFFMSPAKWKRRKRLDHLFLLCTVALKYTTISAPLVLLGFWNSFPKVGKICRLRNTNHHTTHPHLERISVVPQRAQCAGNQKTRINIACCKETVWPHCEVHITAGLLKKQNMPRPRFCIAIQFLSRPLAILCTLCANRSAP